LEIAKPAGLMSAGLCISNTGSIINVGVPRDRNFGTPTFFANKESME